MNNRDKFLLNIRKALGRSGESFPDPSNNVTAMFENESVVNSKVELIRKHILDQYSELASEMAESALQAGWKTKIVNSTFEASEYIKRISADLKASKIICSSQPIIKELGLQKIFRDTKLTIKTGAIDQNSNDEQRTLQRSSIRLNAIEADIGITGVDYAILETGSCVIIPNTGISRLVSLLPPVHIAIVESRQILPSLDELFTLTRHEFLKGNLSSYMNIITGPSRTADIEHTIVTGVHGPAEVHMIIIE